MKANDDVIDALRRTTGLMQGELERSVLTTQMLGTSYAEHNDFPASLIVARRFFYCYPSFNIDNARHTN